MFSQCRIYWTEGFSFLKCKLCVTKVYQRWKLIPYCICYSQYHFSIWLLNCSDHDDVIKWKHFPRYWPFVREIHRSPVNFPHKGHWRGALMFTLICARMHGWVNNREAGDLRRYRVHYDVIVMYSDITSVCQAMWRPATVASHVAYSIQDAAIWLVEIPLAAN